MNITIIGSGNVGSHLFKVFEEKRVSIDAIWSRDIENAMIIDSEKATNSLMFANSDSTIFIITVKDDAIEAVLNGLKIPKNAVLVHTSGAVEMAVLKEKTTNYGIFYPLQTFSKDKWVDFSEIPVLIEASNPQALIELKILAEMISQNVQECSSEQRKQIHLAAVFACNFTNKLLGISKEILEDKNLDFNLLEPLVKETFKKSFELGPKESQTGPAIRGDEKTIAKHLEMLGDQNDYKELYRLISEIIQKS